MAGDPGVEGAHVPLFDRLVDEKPLNPDVARPFRVLSRAELLRSVQREVGRLLNNRLSVSELDIEGTEERTVLTYGIPDFGSTGADSGVDRYKLGRIIAASIERFEPRLVDVMVDIERLSHEESRLVGRVNGTLKVGRMVQPVSFPVRINSDSAGD